MGSNKLWYTGTKTIISKLVNMANTARITKKLIQVSVAEGTRGCIN
jgi:hypothetical protein